jgi:hypothetical protein
MSEYLTWCDKVKSITMNLPGLLLSSANKIKIVSLGDGEEVLLKNIRPEVAYIPRLKVFGEAAYALLDYHLNPEGRVTPNVCPIGPDTLWRQFIPGLPGELWRGNLYKEKLDLDLADMAIIGRVLDSKSAERIALLDFITLFQDRSARNWIIDRNGIFYAIDNGMFWSYKGRHVDREAIRTDNVEHLRPPMEAIISYERQFEFKIGLFSNLFAGYELSEALLWWFLNIDWPTIERDLMTMVEPLGYHPLIAKDWRIESIRSRADWIIAKGRFPTVSETFSGEWQMTIDRPLDQPDIWGPEWEKE